MTSMEDALRASGQYGTPVAVPDDAPVQDRLVGFIGRDPAWAQRGPFLKGPPAERGQDVPPA